MSEKLGHDHLQRRAYVYIRQSSVQQVRHNLESQRRQYNLATRARGLGFRDVVVIDEDLGRSGSGDAERPGFARLLSAVCTGEVGAVLAIEASRLARNNRDWHHLIDLCSLTETLVVDHDGIYDPRLLNDRLLLGLKGTMSEFELGLIRQRGEEARRQMIQRGEVLTEVPVGYVRSRDNRCEMTPDRQVQESVRGVFAKFRELGSARQVLLWYRQARVPLAASTRGTGGYEVTWGLPVYNSIISMLTNPTYAGAFAFGRSTTRTTVVDGRARKTSGHPVPLDEWDVLIHDHHEAYISWEEYLRNRALLEGNARMEGRMRGGAAKGGAALLVGLLRCGRCGRMLRVAYGRERVARYQCMSAHINQGVAKCISFGSLRPDEAVTARVLEVVQPAGIEASLDASEETKKEEDQKRRSLELALERARYEADRARRQYDAADPENRLVTAELEKRWNETLGKTDQIEQQLTSLGSPEVLTQEEKRRLLDLGRDLHAAWSHPAAPETLKKRILRTVLEEIVVNVQDEPPVILLLLHWVGGVHTELRVPKNRTGHHRHCTDRTVVDLVGGLASICDDPTIASILNRLGYRTGAGNTWTKLRVSSLRSHNRIARFEPTATRSWLTLGEAARELGISPSSARRLITDGVLLAQQIVEHAPWMITRESLAQPAVLASAKAIKSGSKAPSPAVGQDRLPLFTER